MKWVTAAWGGAPKETGNAREFDSTWRGKYQEIWQWTENDHAVVFMMHVHVCVCVKGEWR